MKEIPPPSEISKHVRDNYIAQLPMRLTLIRQLLNERRWAKLKQECEKLCRGAKNHGIEDLANLAEQVHQTLPDDYFAVQAIEEESRIMLQRLFQWYEELPGAAKSVPSTVER